MMKRIFVINIILVVAFWSAGILALPKESSAVAVYSSDLIKITCTGANTEVCGAIYYLGADGKRYVFPNEKTYLTWYGDFSGVKSITQEEMQNYPIGGNVTYRPGVKMVKITTDPKVYAVASKGTLRWINSETVAKALYGENWNRQIDDVADAFFVNYKVGSPIESAADYDKTVQEINAISINADKGLVSYTPPLANPATTTPPVIENPESAITISNAVAQNITASSATVFWQTDIPGNSLVAYSQNEISATNPGTLVSDSTLVKNHAVTLNGLSPASKYYITVKSANTGEAKTASLDFTTAISTTSWTAAELTRFYDEVKQPKAVFYDTAFGIVWIGSANGVNDIYFARADANGRRLGQDVNVSQNSDSVSAVSVDIAKSNTGFVVVWVENNAGQGSIKLTNINSIGAINSEVKKFYEDSFGTLPANLRIAKSPSGYGVVWTETRQGDAQDELYFVALDNSGNTTSAVSKVAERGVAVSNPAIVWSNSSFGITWTYNEDSTAVYYIAVDNQGLKSLFPSEKLVSRKRTTDALNPDIIWDGNNYSLAWTELDASSQYTRQQVHYQNYNDSGATTSKSIIITSYDGTSDAYEPKIIWANDTYNIAWRKDKSSIYLVSIDQSYGFKREITSVASGTDIREMALAYGQNNFLILWTDIIAGKRSLLITAGK